jgi:hypothetical protein
VSDEPRTLVISLVSHTNVGKTTLARTLLRMDVGEVFDQAHVTDETERFPLLETDSGDRVVLADTPGFGDSARLLHRLRLQKNPLGWILSQVWDRFRDRPLWCSQQAIAHAREEADVVLYLVNASEDPADAGYVDAELEILEWIGRPVLVLLNQTGEVASPEARAADEVRWREHVRGRACVRGVLSLDAFTRCWVEEGLLFERIRELLPPERRDLAEAWLERWRRENGFVLARSVQALARLLGEAAAAYEPLGERGRGRLERKRAAGALATRLAAAIRDATDRLVELHGLRGEIADEVRARLADVSSASERPSPWSRGILGGLAGGALGGLAADLATGGLSFGGGMVAGAILGAAGLGGLSWAYRLVAGERAPRVIWSPEFLDRQVRDALLRYLAVAHAGRGAGELRLREHPDFWRDGVERAVAAERDALHAIWKRSQASDEGDAGERASTELAPRLDAIARSVLSAFHPEAARLLERPGEPGPAGAAAPP